MNIKGLIIFGFRRRPVATKMEKEITIYDIARELLLSPATVSRALKNHPDVAKATKQTVLAKARELGYRANTFASNLRSRQTNTIGLILHELNSTFITSVLAGVEKITAKEGYDLMITHSNESVAKEAANAHALFLKRVDGVIASLAFETYDLDHFRQFSERNIPVVFFDRAEEDSNYNMVLIDNYRAGYDATKHLVDRGCKRISIFTASMKRNVYQGRFRGYVAALEDSGLSYNPDWVIVSDLSHQAAIDAAMKVLSMDPRPDGIFITGDFSSAVFIRTLKEQGLSLPADMRVVGFNNDAIGSLIEPSLTTVDYPGAKMGEAAATRLIELIQQAEGPVEMKKIVLPSRLIVRDSSL